MNTLTYTDFDFKGQKSVYHGKVRDVYDIDDKYIVMVATDRISAFDVVLPEGIPYKGQVLNQIAAGFLDATADIVPNWKVAHGHRGAEVRAAEDRDDSARLPGRVGMARIRRRGA